MQRPWIVLVMPAAFPASGCAPIVSGRVVTETRPVHGFAARDVENGGSTASLGKLLMEDPTGGISGGGTARVSASDASKGELESGASPVIDGDPEMEQVTADADANIED